MNKKEDKTSGAEGNAECGAEGNVEGGAEGNAEGGVEGGGTDDKFGGVEDNVAGAKYEVAAAKDEVAGAAACDAGAAAYGAGATAYDAGATAYEVAAATYDGGATPYEARAAAYHAANAAYDDGAEGLYSALASQVAEIYIGSSTVNVESQYIGQIPSKLNVSGLYKGFVDPSIFTDYLTYLNFEHNELVEVPAALLALKNIVYLDLSHNQIKYFDETPMFINKLEELSITDNSLLAPPVWIWKNEPRNLRSLNLSNNQNIVCTLKEKDRSEFFYCWLNVYKVVMINCRLETCLDILYTFTGVHELILGGGHKESYKWNELYEFPMEFLPCTEAREVNVNNCKIYDIQETIANYIAIEHLDIGANFIVVLPKEIGELTKLEVLIASFNKLECLPESTVNLKNLRVLLIDNNRIDHLPENFLAALPNMKCLDMYENCVSIVPEGREKLSMFDAAQNYFREPEDIKYTLMRHALRSAHTTYTKVNGQYVYKWYF